MAHKKPLKHEQARISEEMAAILRAEGQTLTAQYVLGTGGNKVIGIRRGLEIRYGFEPANRLAFEKLVGRLWGNDRIQG